MTAEKNKEFEYWLNKYNEDRKEVPPKYEECIVEGVEYNLDSYKTKIAFDGSSFRTVVPMKIMKDLNISKGDVLSWLVNDNGDIIIEIIRDGAEQ